MPPPTISTYHCLCTQLLFATTSHSSLAHFPRRRRDGATICRMQDDPGNDTIALYPAPGPITPTTTTTSSGSSEMQAAGAMGFEAVATVVRLEDGFEKRYRARCGRCGCCVGYGLDWGVWEGEGEGQGQGQGRREDVVFLVEGAVVGTGEMEEGA